MMNWNPEDNWTIPGIYFAEDQAIVHNLASAFEPKAKGGWNVKHEKEAAAQAALDAMEHNSEGEEPEENR